MVVAGSAHSVGVVRTPEVFVEVAVDLESVAAHLAVSPESHRASRSTGGRSRRRTSPAGEDSVDGTDSGIEIGDVHQSKLTGDPIKAGVGQSGQKLGVIEDVADRGAAGRKVLASKLQHRR